MGTFIKIDRKMLNSEIFTNKRKAQQFRVWMYLLMNAAYERKDDDDVKKYGIDHLEPGQLIRARWTICKDLGLTDNQVKSALGYLVKSRMITKSTTGRATVITIVNWRVYQGSQKPSEPDSGQKKNHKKSSSRTAKNPNSPPQTKNIEELYTSYIEEQKEKESPVPPSGGPDQYGTPPDGWDDECEASFMEDVPLNPGKTRQDWWNFWKR